MTRIIFEGLMLGLSTGIYCVGACFIFFLPYLLVEGKQKMPENLKNILLFMSGRLLAYIVFALICGFVGVSFRNIFTVRFSYLCLVVVSLFMLFYSLSHSFKHFDFCALFVERFSLMRIPFFLGLFTGLNPCPPFLVGAVRVWTLHNVLSGVIFFIAFFLGTSAYIVPLIFVSYLNKSERVKQIGLMLAMLSGIWFFFVGISGLYE